jgi:hypothetical protein
MKSISTERIKANLKNIELLLPEAETVLYDFASYLSDRLSLSIVPGGFNVSYSNVLSNMERGISDFPTKPIPVRLLNQTPTVHLYLADALPQIADAVCPKEFANGVKEFYEQVKAKVNK